MKIIAAFALLASANAFAPAPRAIVETRLNAEDSARINNKIDLDSPKVATMDKICDGEKKVYCRCWKSETFPLCDAAHVAHNKETGDNVGPLIVSVEKKEE
eukprot:g8623.t1 g8623   contig3:524439-525072(-)